MNLSLAALQSLAASAGFPNPALAAAIAMAESRGNPGAVGDGGDSIGLWQIDTKFHSQYAKSDLADPTYNARAAYAISSGGTNWRPWSTAWDDAAHEVGYLGANAPFRPYYEPGANSGPSTNTVIVGASAVVVAAAAWFTWHHTKPTRGRSRRRRPAFAFG